MSMTTNHWLAAIAIAALAFHLGRTKGATPAATPTNHGEIQQTGDWWTYAGSWA